MSFNFFLNVKIFELNSKYTGHFFEEKKHRVVWNF
jgi:hypothetical protein